MRVISGTAKGKRLFSPENYSLRPTLDRVKESIFNMISGALPDAAALDLFAGTGQLGIEALSRGAKRCSFVEKDAAACRLIQKNLSYTGLSGCATLIRGDVLASVRRLSGKMLKFDLVFADPPYKCDYFGSSDGINLLKLEYLCDIIAVNGLFIAEHRSRDRLDFGPEFREIRNRVFGQTSITILKRL
ncbi:MAG: 16S rRNA (guanine(966)-N(2))-methyltransferase RsmD [Candidatus Aureabacteria bacterium]|nr:16S rRNA (guanine(966)-N(2))-methyltransferase RsmD [Candidatus Auribacterota bacterium]